MKVSSAIHVPSSIAPLLSEQAIRSTHYIVRQVVTSTYGEVMREDTHDLRFPNLLDLYLAIFGKE